MPNPMGNDWTRTRLYLNPPLFSSYLVKGTADVIETQQILKKQDKLWVDQYTDSNDSSLFKKCMYI